MADLKLFRVTAGIVTELHSHWEQARRTSRKSRATLVEDIDLAVPTQAVDLRLRMSGKRAVS